MGKSPVLTNGLTAPEETQMEARRITDIDSPWYGLWTTAPAPKMERKPDTRTDAEKYWSTLSDSDRAAWRKRFDWNGEHATVAELAHSLRVSK
jgi:hypothetical protein